MTKLVRKCDSTKHLAGESSGELGNDVQSNNAENEDQRQNKDDDRVDLETGGLVGVELQHGAAGATGTGCPCAARASIENLLLLVGGGAAADGSSGTAGRGGR
jgi:hypothetical protein